MKTNPFGLPKYHQLYITHNEHRTNYETIAEYLNFRRTDGEDFNQEELKKCVELDSLWEIQVYPRTPCSFYWTFAADLNDAINEMRTILNENQSP